MVKITLEMNYCVLTGYEGMGPVKGYITNVLVCRGVSNFPWKGNREPDPHMV